MPMHQLPSLSLAVDQHQGGAVHQELLRAIEASVRVRVRRLEEEVLEDLRALFRSAAPQLAASLPTARELTSTDDAAGAMPGAEPSAGKQVLFHPDVRISGNLLARVDDATSELLASPERLAGPPTDASASAASTARRADSGRHGELRQVGQRAFEHLDLRAKRDLDEQVLEFAARSTTIHHIGSTVKTKIWKTNTTMVAEHARANALGKFVQSNSFALFVGMVILTHAAITAHSLELETRGETFTASMWVELGFTIFYILELGVKMWALGRQFFCGVEAPWNWFDLCLVVIAVAEAVLSLLLVSISQSSVDMVEQLIFLRLWRLFRILKIMRVIRVMRTFRELRLLIDAIIGSFKAVLWSLALLVGVKFMFALFFVFTVADLFKGEFTDVEDIDGKQAEAVARTSWSTIGLSCLSMFKAETGGMDWDDLTLPFWYKWKRDGEPISYLVFLIYITFFFFVLANCLAAVILDSVLAIARQDEEQIIEEHLAKKDFYITNLASLFDSMDRDSNGEVLLQEFMRYLKDPRMKAFTASLDIESEDLEHFFTILSGGGKRAVDLETFVVGCIKLRGMARSLDLLGLMLAHQRATESQKVFMTFVDECFALIFERIDGAEGFGQPTPSDAEGFGADVVQEHWHRSAFALVDEQI